MNTMANKRDYYEVLGVARDAQPDQIDSAYRRLAMKYHPDRNPGDDSAADKFKEVAVAHEVLRDPEKRQRYDRFGHAGLEGMDMPDFSSHDFMQSVMDLFGGIFGGGGHGGPRGGRDTRVVVELSLEEAARGVSKQVKFTRAEHCPACKGTGASSPSKRQTCRTCGGRGTFVQGAGFFSVQRACPACQGEGSVITDPCKECEGQGLVAAEATVTVNVPAGIDTNEYFTVRGEGHAGDAGAGRGDLQVIAKVREHSLFTRRGADLVCQAVITFSQAALGCDIEIPTIDGKRMTQTLPRGVQSHEVLSIPNQGMPTGRGRRGNLYVQIVVETPKQLTKRQEELLRELADLEDRNVSPQRRSWLDKVKSFFTEK